MIAIREMAQASRGTWIHQLLTPDSLSVLACRVQEHGILALQAINRHSEWTLAESGPRSNSQTPTQVLGAWTTIATIARQSCFRQLSSSTLREIHSSEAQSLRTSEDSAATIATTTDDSKAFSPINLNFYLNLECISHFEKLYCFNKHLFNGSNIYLFS